MTRLILLGAIWGCIAAQAGSAEGPGKHLFILSGQSNMAGLKPEESFTPTVEKHFGKENVIVVKSAQGGQPIRRWDKTWKPADGQDPKQIGDLYDAMMSAVKAASGDTKIATVTFLWMQGERDAREGNADRYEAAFRKILAQIRSDLKADPIHFVIGRLSDFDMNNKRYRHWTRIRDVQVELAEGDKNGDWVDTDDLNDGKNRTGKEISNDLHYSAEGYVTFGRRLAEKSIALIEK